MMDVICQYRHDLIRLRFLLESIKFEKQLANDERENVRGLILATNEYRKKLANKHHDLKKYV